MFDYQVPKTVTAKAKRHTARTIAELSQEIGSTQETVESVRNNVNIIPQMLAQILRDKQWRLV
jgi:hypothetical protein